VEVDIRKIRDAFKHIRYYDEPHIYIDTNTGKRLTSVTRVVKTYQPKFEAKHISKAIAKKENRPQEEVLAEWDMKRLLGSYRGSLTHSYLENLWSGKVFPVEWPTDVKDTLFKYGKQKEFAQSLTNLEFMSESFIKDHAHYYPVALELVVGNDKIAGQMDLLAWDDKEECLVLVDYKTDKKLLDYSPYNKYFLDPLSHLQDCEINKYSLQLSLYKRLLEDATGLEIKRLEVIWFNHKNDKYQIFKLENKEKEVEALLQAAQ